MSQFSNEYKKNKSKSNGIMSSSYKSIMNLYSLCKQGKISMEECERKIQDIRTNYNNFEKNAKRRKRHLINKHFGR